MLVGFPLRRQPSARRASGSPPRRPFFPFFRSVRLLGSLHVVRSISLIHRLCPYGRVVAWWVCWLDGVLVERGGPKPKNRIP